MHVSIIGMDWTSISTFGRNTVVLRRFTPPLVYVRSLLVHAWSHSEQAQALYVYDPKALHHLLIGDPTAVEQSHFIVEFVHPNTIVTTTPDFRMQELPAYFGSRPHVHYW